MKINILAMRLLSILQKTHNFIWFDSNSIDENKSFGLKHCGKFIEPDLTIFDDSDDIFVLPSENHGRLVRRFIRGGSYIKWE